jgi:hypothetical protein
LWVKQEADWAIISLDFESYAFDGQSAEIVQVIKNTKDVKERVVLRVVEGGGFDAGWALFSPPGERIRINGDPLHTGLRLLRDRDEILVAGRSRIFFSSETLPRVEPFPGADGSVKCARCKSDIKPGDQAVRCPSCAIWYHESPDSGFNCWTYQNSPCMCGQTTDLENPAYRWTPDGL